MRPHLCSWLTLLCACSPLRQGRENEGDLVLAAEFATQANVAFMVRHTNGLLCTTMPAARFVGLFPSGVDRAHLGANDTALLVRTVRPRGGLAVRSAGRCCL